MAAGMIEGMADTCGLYSTVFGRDLDTLDIFLATAAPDLGGLFEHGFLCSSASAWGAATQGDPALQGDPAMSRNLDYFVDTGSAILDAHLLVTLDPDGGQEMVAVGFAGFAGCLSGMNEHGISAALNMGNHYGVQNWSPEFVPICMAMTLGLADEDFDQSGQNDIGDMEEALTCWNRSCSYCIHLAVPPALSPGDPAEVVEVNNLAGWAIRTAGDDPDLEPDRLVLTNHHRILYPPISCWRYGLLSDSLSQDPEAGLARLWALMGDVGFVPQPGTGGTVQTIVMQPGQRRLGVAFSTPGNPSYGQAPRWFEWADLFPNHWPEGVPEGSLQPPLLRPNPASVEVLVTSASRPVLFDMQGRTVSAPAASGGDGWTVDLTSLPPGVYLVGTGGPGPAARLLVLRSPSD
jgi:hypothetical protein